MAKLVCESSDVSVCIVHKKIHIVVWANFLAAFCAIFDSIADISRSKLH